MDELNVQDWNQCLCSLLPRLRNVCSAYTIFRLSLVSKSLKSFYEDFLPVCQFKLNQDGDDRDIHAMLYASSFQKSSSNRGMSNKGATSAEDMTDDLQTSQTSVEVINLSVDLNCKTLSLTKPLKFSKQTKISNGNINCWNSKIVMNKFNVQFHKIEFNNPVNFESLEAPKISFENCSFDQSVFHPMSKGTIISIQNSRVYKKLVVMTNSEANIHIEHCEAKLPQGNMQLFNGMFLMENCLVKNLLLRMN